MQNSLTAKERELVTGLGCAHSKHCGYFGKGNQRSAANVQEKWLIVWIIFAIQFAAAGRI